MEANGLGPNHEVFRFDFTTDPDPTPVNHHREALAFQIMREFCLGPSWSPANPLPQELEATGWIAWQLGVDAERASREGKHEAALRLARTSVHLAWRVRDLQRIYSNLTTLGNVLFAAGKLDDAEFAFRQILEIPFEGRWQDKGIARMNLGNTLRAKGDNRAAAWNIERGLAWIGDLMQHKQRSVVLRGLAQLYGELNDLPGVICCASELIPPERFASVLETFCFKDVDAAMAIVTRCKALGKRELANRMHDMWLIQREERK